MIFIHTSDWHLGRAYARLGADAASWRFSAVRRIYELALENGAAFILVAGDVFDTDTPGVETIRSVVDLLREAPVPVYLISGNHDPCAEGSVWQDARFVDALKGAVRVHLLGTAGEVELEGGTLFACPVTAKHSRQDATAWMAGSGRGGKFRIGLAHGGWRGYWGPGEEGTGALNEIDAGVSERCGLDYLALGDYHGYTPANHAAAAVRTYYSGTPEPGASRDVRGGHVLVVEIDEPGGAPRVTPHRVGRLRICDWGNVTLQQGTGSQSLQTRFTEIEDAPNSMLRAGLRGVVSEDDWQAVQSWINGLQGQVLAADIDQSRLIIQPTSEDFAKLQLEDSEKHLLEMLDGPLEAEALMGVDNGDTLIGWSEDEEARREARALLYQLLRGD